MVCEVIWNSAIELALMQELPDLRQRSILNTHPFK